MAAPSLYSDAALTTALSTIVARQRSDGSTPPIQQQCWIGSTETGWQHRVAANPGVDQIAISVTDTTPGSGHATTEVKLALTKEGLASAVAGAALNIGTTILGGSANAATFWVEINDVTGVVATVTELGLTTQELATDAL